METIAITISMAAGVIISGAIAIILDIRFKCKWPQIYFLLGIIAMTPTWIISMILYFNSI